MFEMAGGAVKITGWLLKSLQGTDLDPEQEQFSEMLEIIFELYKEGRVNDAIEYIQLSQSEENCYCENLKPLIPVMLYKQKKYEEAIKYGYNIINALCYEKLGNNEKATKELNDAVDYLCSQKGNFDSSKKTFLTTKFSDVEFWFECQVYGESPVDIDITEIIPLLKTRIDKGDKNFSYFMGVIFEEGIGVEKDYKKAKEWFEKTIKNNAKHIENAYERLAWYHFYGKDYGFERNKELGIEYMKKAVSLNCPIAKDNLKYFKLRKTFPFLEILDKFF